MSLASRVLKSYITAGGVVHGGGSFNDAGKIQPGQFQDTLIADETPYYAVTLVAGQELSATTTVVGQPEVNPISKLDRAMVFKLTLYDAARKDATFDSAAFWGDTTDTRSAHLPPVSRAGVYYVSLGLERTNAPAMQRREFKTELLIEVTGHAITIDPSLSARLTHYHPGSADRRDRSNRCRTRLTDVRAVQSDQSKRYRETLWVSGLARQADRATL